jgi:hypothetical protein
MSVSLPAHFWVLDQWNGHPVKRRNNNALRADEARRRHFETTSRGGEVNFRPVARAQVVRLHVRRRLCCWPVGAACKLNVVTRNPEGMTDATLTYD